VRGETDPLLPLPGLEKQRGFEVPEDPEQWFVVSDYFAWSIFERNTHKGVH
jgi:hypothetical protein